MRGRRLIPFIDLTSLDEADTNEKIARMCDRALEAGVAAVCVLPKFAAAARDHLSGSNVRVAAAAGGFPNGRATLDRRLEEIRHALEEGAEEIDTVLDPAAADPGDGAERAATEIAASKEACGERVMKVILETGRLRSPGRIRHAALLAMNAGADFVKTSTGKIPMGADVPAVEAMIAAVKEFLEETGRRTGIKVSGASARRGRPRSTPVFWRPNSDRIGSCRASFG